MSVNDFCRRYRIGRTKAYEEINAGRLKAKKSGRRTIIAEDDAEEWLSLLPAFHEDSAAEVRSDVSARSTTQESLPNKPTAAADALKLNVSQHGRDGKGGRDFEQTLERKPPDRWQASGGHSPTGVKADDEYS
jgi:hypothetical protein